MRSVMLVGLVLLASWPARAAEHGSWEEYIKANRYKCPGPFDTLKKPVTVMLGGKAYLHTGYRLEVQAPDADQTVKLGVVSAIKDVTQATRANLADALAWFKEQGVEWLIANGDLALEEFDLEAVLDLLGDSGLPVLVVLGNSESKGSFARAYSERLKKHPNLINGVLIRQIVADDIELWTMPGYFDRKFAHATAVCNYQEEEVRATLAALKPSGKAPVALVSHGPPAGKGKNALDVIPTGENVGDRLLNEILTKANIKLGLFGHILEAGGRAVGKDFSTPVKPSSDSAYLYLNAGSLSGDPWGMLDGSTSYGIAMVVTVSGERAQYQVKKFPNRVSDEGE